MNKSKTSAVNGMIWKMAEQMLSMVVQFLLSVVIARLVLPEEYEIIALISVFITVSELLANAGFGTAIIQKREIDQMDISSVFVFSSCAAVVIWIVLYIVAPYIAEFYNQPLIISVLRIYAIVVWPTSVYGILRAILMRQMEFKKLFFSSMIPLILSGIVGVIVALFGGGVYALVIQALINAFLTMIILFFVTKWRPSLQVDIYKIRELWSYSSKLVMANLIDTGYKNLYPLCIPKAFGSGILGYYSYGRQIANTVVSAINATVNTVMFPIFSRKQEDKDMLKVVLRKTVRMCNFCIFPIMGGIFVLADTVIWMVLGEKWVGSAWFLRFFCIAYGLQHIQNLGFQAISACGRSDVYLRYEIVKKVIGVLVLVVSLLLGIEALMWGQIISAVLFVLLSLYPEKKWLGYSIIEQIKDLFPFLGITLIMCIGVYYIGMLAVGWNLYLKTTFQVIIGVVVYIVEAYLFNIEELKDILVLVQNRK